MTYFTSNPTFTVTLPDFACSFLNAYRNVAAIVMPSSLRDQRYDLDLARQRRAEREAERSQEHSLTTSPENASQGSYASTAAGTPNLVSSPGASFPSTFSSPQQSQRRSGQSEGLGQLFRSRSNSLSQSKFKLFFLVQLHCTIQHYERDGDGVTTVKGEGPSV